MNGRGIDRWRWRTAAAFVLAVLVLAQACGDGSRSTGPTQATALQLKIRRASAQIPTGCSASYEIKTGTGPGAKTVAQGNVGEGGTITFQGQIGVAYTIIVTLDCGAQGKFVGETSLTVQPGVNQAEVVVTATSAGVSCSPSPVLPGQSTTCTCNVKSPSPNPTITWQGPGGSPSGNPVAFSSQNPGTYGVSCTVNGVATAQTSFTVTEAPPPPEGILRVTNPDQCGDGCGTTLLNIRIDGVTVASSLPLGGNLSRTVPAGPHEVRASCPNEGPPFEHPDSPKTATVPSDGTATVTFNSEACFGQ